MSLNVFNTAFVSDTFPPCQVGPGGGLPYIYIYRGDLCIFHAYSLRIPNKSTRPPSPPKKTTQELPKPQPGDVQEKKTEPEPEPPPKKKYIHIPPPPKKTYIYI